MSEIGDDALLSFARWCRMNDPKYVLDPVILRRVFDAYAAVPNVVLDGPDE